MVTRARTTRSPRTPRRVRVAKKKTTEETQDGLFSDGEEGDTLPIPAPIISAPTAGSPRILLNGVADSVKPKLQRHSFYSIAGAVVVTLLLLITYAIVQFQNTPGFLIVSSNTEKVTMLKDAFAAYRTASRSRNNAEYLPPVYVMDQVAVSAKGGVFERGLTIVTERGRSIAEFAYSIIDKSQLELVRSRFSTILMVEDLLPQRFDRSPFRSDFYEAVRSRLQRYSNVIVVFDIATCKNMATISKKVRAEFNDTVCNSSPSAYIESFKRFVYVVGVQKGALPSECRYVPLQGIISSPEKWVSQLFFHSNPVYAEQWHQNELAERENGVEEPLPEFDFWKHVQSLREESGIGLKNGNHGFLGLGNPIQYFSSFWPFAKFATVYNIGLIGKEGAGKSKQSVFARYTTTGIVSLSLH